jgi:hypothetical protein
MSHQSPDEIIRRLQGLSIDDDAALALFRELAHFDPGSHAGQSELRRFLNSADPLVRGAALRVLVYEWATYELSDECLSMLETDPDEFVRISAAGCLGSIHEKTRNPNVARRLAAVVQQQDENPFVREFAYSGLLLVLGVEVRDLPSSARDFDLVADVDWPLVAKWAAETRHQD